MTKPPDKSAFKGNSFKTLRKGFQFSMRFLLVVLTLSCVLLGVISQDAIENRKAIDLFTSDEIQGEISSYRQTWFGAFAPTSMQIAIGKEYFWVPDTVSVKVRLDVTDKASSHNGQQVIDSLAQFGRLSKLDLRLRQIDMKPACYDSSAMDLGGLEDLVVEQLDVDTSNQFAADVVRRLPSKRLSICGCELNGPLAKSVLANDRLLELRFQKARITAENLLRLDEMESLTSVVFIECRPVANSGGTFDILSDPFPAKRPNPWNGLGPKAIGWIQLNLPGINIVGLGAANKSVAQQAP